MNSIRSLLPAACLTAALIAVAPAARAQGVYYGQGYGGYGQMGFNPGYGGYAPGVVGGGGYGAPYGNVDVGATLSNPWMANRAARTSRKGNGRSQPAVGTADRHASTPGAAPYTPMNTTRPATVDPRLNSLVNHGGGGTLDPYVTPLQPNVPELGRGTPNLNARTSQLDAGTSRLNARMPQLGGGVPQLGTGMPQLGAGTPQLNAGTPQLGGRTPQLGTGIPQLGTGIPQLGGGVPQLGTGMPQLGPGMPRLDGAIPRLNVRSPLL